MGNRGAWVRWIVLMCITAVLLSGCSGGGDAPTSAPDRIPYPIPEFHDAVFHSDQAKDYSGCQVDFSGVSDGYIALTASNDKRMKLLITLGQMRYTYDVSGSGEPEVFPLNMGSGDYSFQLMENVGESKYVCIWEETVSAALTDEFQPFLRPSQMVPYSENSKCVALARELAGKCSTDAEVAAAVYKYLAENIRYDTQKAATVRSGYLPNPDNTLAEGTGICFDYSSLAASMLRSLGIPCKMIFGNVNQGGVDVYHAWNAFYLKEEGWVTAEIKANPNTWQRVDITFAAGGASAQDLLNDGLYTGQYTY